MEYRHVTLNTNRQNTPGKRDALLLFASEFRDKVGVVNEALIKTRRKAGLIRNPLDFGRGAGAMERRGVADGERVRGGVLILVRLGLTYDELPRVPL